MIVQSMELVKFFKYTLFTSSDQRAQDLVRISFLVSVRVYAYILY